MKVEVEGENEVLSHNYKLKLAPSSRFITVSTDGSGTPFYFVVGGIISVEGGPIWLVVKHCCVDDALGAQVPDYKKTLWIKATLPAFYEPHSTSHLLELSEYVRKVGCVHDCCNCTNKEPCTADSERKTVKHSVKATDGGHFFILPRFAGYPPRRS